MSNSESRKRLAATPDPDPHTPDWLPAHDAKVAARALREAALPVAQEISRRLLQIGHDPGTTGTAAALAQQALRGRADEIERAGRAGGGA